MQERLPEMISCIVQFEVSIVEQMGGLINNMTHIMNLILQVWHLFQLPDGKKAGAEINPLFGWELNLSESLGGLEKKTNPGFIQIKQL